MDHISIDYSKATPDEIAEIYVKFREAKSQLAKRDAVLAQNMKEAEQAMLAYMAKTNTESFRANGITVSRTTKQLISCADWSTFQDWLIDRIDNAASMDEAKAVFGYLQKRLSTTEIKHYMEEHEGAIPPAVSVLPEYGVSVTVRRT